MVRQRQRQRQTQIDTQRERETHTERDLDILYIFEVLRPTWCSAHYRRPHKGCAFHYLIFVVFVFSFAIFFVLLLVPCAKKKRSLE